MSPRVKFIATITIKKLAGYCWDAMQLASTHDPEHAIELDELRTRVAVLERQMERIGAPMYRTKGNLLIERVRNLPKADYPVRTN